MVPQPPSGQGPIDPRSAFSPPPPPGGAGSFQSPGFQAPGFQAQAFTAGPVSQTQSPQGIGQTGGPPPGWMPPGPGMYPPPIMMPPPGFFKPQKSFARIIFTTLASIVFLGSLTLNIFLFLGLVAGGGLSSHGSGLTESVLVEGDIKEKIVVIPLGGVIMEGTAQRFNSMLDVAEKDANVKAIVIEIDTPGGAVTASDEIYARVMKFRAANPAKPVVVSMGGLATSGGYYVSCAADYIIAQPTTLTGNIGVIMPRYNFSGLASKYGVEESTITAPAVGFKNAGSMFVPAKPEETAYLQGLIDDMFGNFKSAVTTGRGPKLKKKIEEIANGKVYTCAEAMKLGLVDSPGYGTDAYDKAASLAGLPNKHVVRYGRQQSLLDLLTSESKSNIAGAVAGAGGGAGNITINGVNFNVDAHLLDELNRPQMMYLWRGQ